MVQSRTCSGARLRCEGAPNPGSTQRAFADFPTTPRRRPTSLASRARPPRPPHAFDRQYDFPARRRRAIEHVPRVMDVSERRVCRVAGRHRSTQRRTVALNPYRDKLVAEMRELAVGNPRRGRR